MLIKFFVEGHDLTLALDGNIDCERVFELVGLAVDEIDVPSMLDFFLEVMRRHCEESHSHS